MTAGTRDVGVHVCSESSPRGFRITEYTLRRWRSRRRSPGCWARRPFWLPCRWPDGSDGSGRRSPGRVRERAIGSSEWTWESGRGEAREGADPVHEGLPIRIFIFTPFIALRARDGRRHCDCCASDRRRRRNDAGDKTSSGDVGEHSHAAGRLSRTFAAACRRRATMTLVSLLRSQAVGTNGRAFIIDKTGKLIASSASAGDPVVESAIAALARHTGPSGLSARSGSSSSTMSRRSRSHGKRG